jgi:hypothetical protein
MAFANHLLPSKVKRHQDSFYRQSDLSVINSAGKVVCRKILNCLRMGQSPNDLVKVLKNRANVARYWALDTKGRKVESRAIHAVWKEICGMLTGCDKMNCI